MLRRRNLLAYLIGAGVAGTLLVGPYVVRDAAIRFFVPGRTLPLVPFFLLPVFWGLWNLLRARRYPLVAIGTWGALLGLVAAVAMNLYLRSRQAWLGAALFLVVFSSRGLLPRLALPRRAAERSPGRRRRAAGRRRHLPSEEDSEPTPWRDGYPCFSSSSAQRA